MSEIKDIRIECEDMPTPGEALGARWPCAPGGVKDSRSSGLICATVMARAMWSRLKPQCWPEPNPDEDPITTYTFADFREDEPALKEALQDIWDKAKESATRQQDGQADDSFAGIGRSPGFVKAFWANPRFQLTTPHWRAGRAYNKRTAVLEGDNLARQAVVTWDGVKPATVQDAVNGATFKTFDNQGNMTFAFFKSPMLLQVDFTPGEGSKHSLADLQTFTAKKWNFVCNSYGMSDGKWEVTGEVTYTIMAIVLHRDTKDGVDSVRLFRGNGREELPVVPRGQVQWPFDLDDPVPVGHMITVLYNSVSSRSEVLDFLRESERFAKAPLDTQREFRAQLGPGSVERDGGEVDTDIDREQVEKDLSVFTRLAAWKESLARPKAPSPGAAPQPPESQPGPQDEDSLFLEALVKFIGEQVPHPQAARGKMSDPPPTSSLPDRTSMPPKNAPTEPRADRELKRPREHGEEPRGHDYKRPRRPERSPIRGRVAPRVAPTGSNAVGISGNRLRPDRANEVDTREGLDQQGSRGPWQTSHGRGGGERRGGGRFSSARR